MVKVVSSLEWIFHVRVECHSFSLGCLSSLNYLAYCPLGIEDAKSEESRMTEYAILCVVQYSVCVLHVTYVRGPVLSRGSH